MTVSFSLSSASWFLGRCCSVMIPRTHWTPIVLLLLVALIVSYHYDLVIIVWLHRRAYVFTQSILANLKCSQNVSI